MKLSFGRCFIVALAFLINPVLSSAEEVSIDLSGFMDMSYFHKDGAGDTASQAKKQTFALDQAELDFTSEADSLAARLDLQFINTDETLKAFDIVEQAYAVVSSSSYYLLLGKFNSPFGSEGTEPTEMKQYSLAMINEYGIPGDLTGVMMVYTQGTFEMDIFYVNGNDMQLSSFSDNNTEKTYGGRIALSSEDAFSMGFSYITGKENATDSTSTDKNDLTIWDIDMMYVSNEKLYLIAQYNNGTFERESGITQGADAKWNGYLLKMHYTTDGTWGLTIRYDKIEDEGAIIFANATSSASVDSYTGALTFAFADNFGGVLEYRTFSANSSIWVDSNGNTKSGYSNWAVEFTYSF